MRNRFVRLSLAGSILAAVAVLAFSPIILSPTAQQPGTANAQTAAHPTDLTGLWARHSDRSYARRFDEVPPMTPWAEEKYKVVTEGMAPDEGARDDTDPIITACAPGGMTRILQQGRPFEIFQVPGRVLIVFEVDSKVRHIWMDGREHPEDPHPTWMGHSIGRWDGDTLVVDTVGLNDKSWLDSGGHPHSEALHVVERFRRVSHDALEVEVMYEDPLAYRKPWRGKLNFQLKPDWELMEWVTCDDRIHRRLESDPCVNPSWELAVICKERGSRLRQGK